MKRIECELEGCGRAAALLEVLTPFGCPVVCEPCAYAIQAASQTIGTDYAAREAGEEVVETFMLEHAQDVMRRVRDVMRFGPADHSGRLEHVFAEARAKWAAG